MIIGIILIIGNYELTTGILVVLYRDKTMNSVPNEILRYMTALRSCSAIVLSCEQETCL